MMENLFDLDFSRWDDIFMFLVPALINAGIFLYISFFLPQSRTNNSFSVFVLLLGLWQTTEGFMRMSNTAETAFEWTKISGICLLLMFPFGIFFILYFSKWYKNISHNFLFLLLFVPTFILCFFVIEKMDKMIMVKSEYWHWVVNPNTTFNSMLLYGWITVCSSLMLTLLWLLYVKAKKDELRKKQSLLLVLGFSMPVITGIIAEIIFPIFFGLNDIPIAAPLVTIFSITTLMALTKYKFLNFSPKYQWDQIAESMSEGILIVNNNDQIVYANQPFCKLSGYKFEEIKGKLASKLFLEDVDVGQNKQLIEERKSKRMSQYEVVFKKKSGKKLSVIVSGSPYCDKSGKVIGSIGIHTNITERKQAEDAHLASLQILEGIINTIHVRIFWKDRNLNYLGCNKIFAQDAGFSDPQELIGKDDYQMGWRNQADLYRNDDRQVIESGCPKLNIEEPSTTPTGNRITLLTNKIPLRNSKGETNGVLGTYVDITERKQIENKLQNSETRLLIAQAVAKIGSWETDLLTLDVIWSAETYHIFEINPEGFQASHPNVLTYVHPEDREIVDAAFIGSFNKHSNNSIEHRIITPKGQIKFVEERWQIIHNDKGQPLKAIGTCQDITERKKAESILKATNKELELFIYKASHDLRGPLASILGLINLSSTEIKEAKTIEYIRMIEYSAKKLDATLSMLVQSVFIKDTKKFEDEINFKWMIMETLAKLEYSSGFSRIQITTNVLQTFSFLSSKMVIQSLLQNLIENAIKYQDTKKENSFLNIHVSGNNQEIKIIMEDNGIGIDTSIQHNIFDMYYRGTNRSTGSGLGLYLVRTGVEKLGGTISLESELGKGSTFTISLSQVQSDH